MTERKPPGISFESWVDKQIREATARGEFDNLPGAGKPIPGAGQPYDENWWVQNLIHREGLATSPLLPTSLRLRREVEQLPEVVTGLPSEQAVRDQVADLNQRITAWLRLPRPPHVPLAPRRPRPPGRALAHQPPPTPTPAGSSTPPPPMVAPNPPVSLGTMTRAGR